jgi:hypothetical protein
MSVVWYVLRLDYTAATFPVTFASKQKDPKLASYIPINERDKECYDECIIVLCAVDFR